MVCLTLTGAAVVNQVLSATILETVEPLYNRLLLAAAKMWTCRPARLDGTPVKYRKRIQVTLSKNQTTPE